MNLTFGQYVYLCFVVGLEVIEKTGTDFQKKCRLGTSMGIDKFSKFPKASKIFLKMLWKFSKKIQNT